MKITKRIASLLLAVLTVLSMLTLTACGDTTWVAKYNDETVPAGIYPLAVMLAYENVYANSYGSVDLSGPVSLEDGTQTTVREYITSTAKETVKNYIAAKAMFEELNLSYSDKIYNEYMATLGGYYTAQSSIYKENGISKESFEELVINHSLRLNALTEYFAEQYVTSSTDYYVSDGDIKNYFRDNYLRFNYMTYYAISEDGSYLTEDSEEYKAELAYLTDITNKQLSQEEYLKIAEKYTDGSGNRLGGMEMAVNIDDALADPNLGDVCAYISELELGESGIYTYSYYDQYYNICYAVFAAQRIEPEQSGVDYLLESNNILASMCTENLYADFEEVYAELGVTENENVYKTFAPDKMNFEGFVSINPNNQ